MFLKFSEDCKKVLSQSCNKFQILKNQVSIKEFQKVSQVSKVSVVREQAQ